ncbi:MAG: HYR domain-containing protein [Haliscomenobacteraceae bacterium CHB4]|nr:HYR domain-containing protein [Haliscomenobacteraceae bacterium CHB4]
MTTPGACAQEYSVTRTWTATDACMNASTCSRTISVEDNTAPVITCAAQISPMECPATPQWVAPTVADACDAAPTVTFNDVTTPGACPQEYSVTRTWTATDACMNASTCSRTISVEDNTAPVVTCAAQVTPVECPAMPQWVAPTVTDACDATPTVTFNDVTTPGACPQEYSVTRTWTATDACMNASTCSRTITVEDNTAPVVTCVTQISPIECPSTPQWFAPNVTDACDGAPTVTFNDVTTPGACPQEYSVTRTWTATDACMNASTCSRTISVEDNTAPIITCASQSSPVECPATPQWVAPTATDACDAAPTITFSDVTTPGACSQEYSVTRIWTATDACMNASTCSRTISVEDNTAPVITCASQSSPVECPAMPQWVAATATDACDATPTVTFNDVTTPGACPQEYSVTRTWTATDDCMNSSTCSRTIIVEDNTAPVVTCATQTSPIECPATPQWVAATAADACDPSPVVTFSDVTTPGACPQEYSVTRTWTATDACMNSSTCSRTIVVQDNTAPVITCAAQMSPVECPATPQWVAPSVADACDAAPVVTFSDVTTPGACPQEYSVTRTWTATDACMNASTCSRTIAVQDNTAPVITCAAQVSPVECPATPQWVAPSVADACDAAPVVTFSDVTTPGACAQEYSVTRTWTATDACMNASTCSRTIVVEDNTAPVITCAAQISPVECPATPQWVAPTVADACDAAPTVTFNDVTTPGACPQEYSVTRTWTATDACMNASTCSRTIAVEDNTAPDIACAPITVSCASEVPAPDPNALMVSDNCGGAVTVSHVGDVISNQTCPDNYTLTRTYMATDACGNTATCEQIITVNDQVGPNIICPAGTIVPCATAVPSADPTIIGATDNCGGPVIIVHVGDVISNQICPDNYTLTRTYLATDECGNTATCDQIISVLDDSPPIIICPDPITVDCADEIPAPDTSLVFALDTSLCNTCKAFCTYTQGAYGNAGGIHSNGLNTSETLDILLMAGPIVVGGGSGNCGFEVATTQCVLDILSAGGPSDPLPQNYTLDCTQALDNNLAGQVIALQLNIRYNLEFNDGLDLGAAALSCALTPDQIEELDLDSEATVNDLLALSNLYLASICNGSIYPGGFGGLLASATTAINEFWDECQQQPGPGGGGTVITFVSDEITNQTCDNRYTVIRTYQAEDECGNIATCTQTITVDDQTAPVITCAAQTTPIECPAAPQWVAPTVTDNCGGTPTVTFSDVTTPGACAQEYSVTRTWTATDDCLNTSTCSRTVTVEDNTAPVITCAAQTTPIECPATPQWVAATATDACDATPTVTFSDVTTPGVCPQVSIVTRTWTATDDCLNTSTCSRSIALEDHTAPVITCAAQTTPIECPATPQWVAATATDACDATPTITFSDVTTPGACAQEYSVTRTWTATDDCLNTSTCSRTIAVNDQAAPTAYFIVNGVPNATEAYEICGEVDLVLDRAGINPSQPLTITLTISGTATSGADYSPLNASYTIPAGQNQLIIPITIVDDMLPEGSETIVISFGQSCSCDKTEKTLKISDLTTAITLTCPSDITVDTDPAVVVYTPPLATTDCPCPGIELELTEGLPSGSVFPLGTTTVCYIARDSCGNTATCCFNVTVVEAPELPCDEVIAGCVKFELIEITEDNAGNNTYKIRVTNNCVNKLMYVAFSLPPGVTALAPPNNSIYTAPSGNEYSVRNPNFSPFYSIRFYSAIIGIASGASDIFEYTLPSLANPPFIHVIVRLQPKIFLEGYLSTADCIVEPEPKPGPKKADMTIFKKSLERSPGHFTVFPNPTTGLLFADLTEWQGEQVQVQVFDSRGGRIQQTALTADVAPQEIQLPKDLPGGLYFLEIVTENGERQTVRFMLQH